MTEKYHDKEYLALVRRILDTGEEKQDRTGTGTLSIAFQQMRFDLSDMSIPLLTSKKMFTRGIIHEILWYLTGSSNIKYLTDNNVHIWDEWADINGSLGPVYGYQWRKWPVAVGSRWLMDPDYPEHTAIVWDSIDQVADMVHRLRTDPTDRRIILSGWNVGQLEHMALPPCHAFYQILSNGKGELRAHLYQRSCDTGLGVPFNIVQYSILTHMFAHVTGHKAVEFVWTGGDVHIYKNHVKQMEEQCSRLPNIYPSPTLRLNSDVKEIDDFTFEDFEIVGYDKHHPGIPMKVSV